MFSNKSILARLLANENIRVIQSNCSTASFNVETRVLQLPLWKEMSGDVYDLLVGHEVAHALWTPRENLAIEGVPFSFVNVVEDIRIEKLVLRKYPGLVSNFSRGYLDLVERDLFGTKGKDLNELPFMDRLNLKAKGRQHVDISFTEEEQYYVNRAMSVETFDDVREVVLELAAWLKEKQAESISQELISSGDLEESAEGEPMEGEGFGEMGEGESENEEDGESVSAEEAESGESGSGDESDDSEGLGSAQGSSESDESEETVEDKRKLAKKDESHGGISDNDQPLAEVATDVAQKENEAELVDSSTLYVESMTRERYKNRLVPYSKVLERRKREVLITPTFENRYTEFLAESKPIVNLMVKEFEMRKAAYRNLRARTSTKGTLDVNKLHQYKYDDHLFKQVTTLADGKNHGMIMMIDYSGSMGRVLGSVIRQTINLVQFCKRVNIPFRVYAFTTSTALSSDLPRDNNGMISFDDRELVLLELFNSTMSKVDYEYAIKSFFVRSVDRHNAPYAERLGSTPLNAALMAMPYAIADFRKAHSIHKLNLVTLTDGESDRANYIRGIDTEDRRRGDFHSAVTQLGRRQVTFPTRMYDNRSNVRFTRDLISTLSEEYNVRTINYFISDSYAIKDLAARDVVDHGPEGYDWVKVSDASKKIRSEANKNGVYVNDNKTRSGYDRQFVLIQKANNIAASVDDLNVPDGASAAKLAKAFTKFSDSKKKSRILTKKFAEIVA